MVTMKMSYAYKAYGIYTPSLLFNGNLSSLTTVYKYAVSIVSGKQRGEEPVR